MAETAKADLTRTIEQKTKSYNRDMEDAQDAAVSGGAKQAAGRSQRQKMMQVIEKYAQANGYAVMLDVSNPQTPVMYASSSANITKDIIELYDKTMPGARPRRPARNPGRALASPPNRPQCQPRRSSRNPEMSSENTNPGSWRWHAGAGAYACASRPRKSARSISRPPWSALRKARRPSRSLNKRLREKGRSGRQGRRSPRASGSAPARRRGHVGYRQRT